MGTQASLNWPLLRKKKKSDPNLDLKFCPFNLVLVPKWDFFCWGQRVRRGASETAPHRNLARRMIQLWVASGHSMGRRREAESWHEGQKKKKKGVGDEMANCVAMVRATQIRKATTHLAGLQLDFQRLCDVHVEVGRAFPIARSRGAINNFHRQ